MTHSKKQRQPITRKSKTRTRHKDSIGGATSGSTSAYVTAVVSDVFTGWFRDSPGVSTQSYGNTRGGTRRRIHTPSSVIRKSFKKR